MMSELQKQTAERLNAGVPLRLDQTAGLMLEGIDAKTVTEAIEEDLELNGRLEDKYSYLFGLDEDDEDDE